MIHYKTDPKFWPWLRCVDAIGSAIFFWKHTHALASKPKDILLIRLDHLGDMIMTSAFVRNIRRRYPHTRVHMLCRPLTAPLARMIPGIDVVHTIEVPWFSRNDRTGFNRFFEWCKESVVLLKWMYDHLNHFDIAFELHTDPRDIMIAWAAGRRSVGYPNRGLGFLLDIKVPWNERHPHNVERMLDIIRYIGGRIDDGHLTLHPSAHALVSLKRKLRKVAILQPLESITVLHPLSARPEKDWIWSGWREVVDNLVKSGNQVIIGSTVGQSAQIYAGLGEHIRWVHLSHALGLSLDEYIVLIQSAKQLVTVDTFTVHVRASVQRPMIALYGATRPEEWGPFPIWTKHVKYRCIVGGRVDDVSGNFLKTVPASRILRVL